MFTRLLVWSFPWGGVVDVSPMSITGHPLFDYFFTLVMIFALVALLIGWLVNVLTRT